MELCVMKRKKGASNEPGATWARDTVWMASASRSLGKRKRVQLSAKSWSNDGPLKRRRGTQSQPSHRKESTLRTYKRVFLGGGLKSSSLYGSTSSGLCVWCQFRPTSWVMTRSAEGGCETSGGIYPLTDPLELTLCPVADLCS